MKSNKWNVFFTYVFLVFIAIICMGPFLWILSASFKDSTDMHSLSIIPKHFTLENFTGLLSFIRFDKYFANSMIITVGGIVLDIVLATLCAYPLAKMKFRGKAFINGVLLSTMILPASAGLIVNYITISKLGLLDTYLGMILPSAVSAFSIILLRQAFLSVPNALIESARIDGASELVIWFKIMIPSIMPSITTIIIMDFINKWNTFLWPIIVASPEKYPIAAALQSLNSQFTYKFGYIASSTVLSIVPVIIVFIIFQKNYLRSLSGAVK